MTGIHKWGWGEGGKALAFWGWSGPAATAGGRAAVAWVWDDDPYTAVSACRPGGFTGGLPEAPGPVRSDRVPSAASVAVIGAVNHPRGDGLASTAVLSTGAAVASHGTGAGAVSLDGASAVSEQTTEHFRTVRDKAIPETVKG